MRVDLFDFDLPEDRIALRPAEDRSAARLLIVRPGSPAEFEDRRIGDLPALLRAGDTLVVNDTQVLPARLSGLRRREGGPAARIEAMLVERLDAGSWRVFARPAKRLKPGDRVEFSPFGDDGQAMVAATVSARREGEVDLAFDLSGAELDGALAGIGEMPLPPYIAARRPPDERDRADYQTVFAARPGAIAAPTAGLHFGPALLVALETAGIAVERVTLHVGAGTFLPVKADDTADHVMHSEWGRIDAATAARLLQCQARGNRVVAVGTTALRVLESAAGEGGTIAPWEGRTNIFITPGYRFRAVDALLTNFHLPRSTLVMLVAAFVGLDVQRAAYAYAIAEGYRFYSYGDASLLFRAG